tara:strand:+ start:21 stop:266 length:246 start_codon:yes stop_codon:yes gene_type:complete
LIRVIYYLSIFLSPLLIYLFWIFLSKGKVIEFKIFWSLLIGLSLMAIVLFSSAIFNNVSIEKKYIHPEVINGKLKEGHFIE